MCSIVSPLADVFCAIRPCLLTKTISESTFPLTSVNSTTFESVCRSVFTRLVWLINSFSNCFSSFILCEIFARALQLRSKHADLTTCSIAFPPSLNFDDVFNIFLQVLIEIFFFFFLCIFVIYNSFCCLSCPCSNSRGFLRAVFHTCSCLVLSG